MQTSTLSQEKRVLQILLKEGFIDNFRSINERISIRLGAIIYKLRNKGYVIETIMKNKNCHYFLRKVPSFEKSKKGAKK